MYGHLHQALHKLKQRLLQLAEIVEVFVEEGTISLEKSDLELAHKVIKKDQEIDFLEVEIEEEALKILALHQPVAIDLRVLVAILKINNELERVADLACNISKCAIIVSKYPKIEIPFNSSQMSLIAREMLHNVVQAFIDQNIDLARKVCINDKELDELKNQAMKIVYEEIKQNPQHVEVYTQYLSLARLLERIGDYATNIAEDIIYMISGEIVRHSL